MDEVKDRRGGLRVARRDIDVPGLVPFGIGARHWLMDRWHFMNQLATNLIILGVIGGSLQLVGALLLSASSPSQRGYFIGL